MGAFEFTEMELHWPKKGRVQVPYVMDEYDVHEALREHLSAVGINIGEGYSLHTNICDSTLSYNTVYKFYDIHLHELDIDGDASIVHWQQFYDHFVGLGYYVVHQSSWRLAHGANRRCNSVRFWVYPKSIRTQEYIKWINPSSKYTNEKNRREREGFGNWFDYVILGTTESIS